MNAITAVCKCGCGKPTTLALTACRKRGYVAGQPHAYLRGHHSRKRKSSIEIRFHDLVEKTPSGCWLWKAAVDTDGYGQVWAWGRQSRAHRVSWILAHGSISSDQQVLHRCDVRRCVNPDHLFLGTNATNQADMRAKGRHVHGPNHPDSRLSEQQALDILRNRAVSHREMARRHGVSRVTVRNIRLGRRWKHIHEQGGAL